MYDYLNLERVSWVDPRVREGGGGFGVVKSLGLVLLVSLHPAPKVVKRY